MFFPKFVNMTKNTALFFQFCTFLHPLNDVRTYIAWSWKTTLITWIFLRGWYPTLNTSAPPPGWIIMNWFAYGQLIHSTNKMQQFYNFKLCRMTFGVLHTDICMLMIQDIEFFFFFYYTVAFNYLKYCFPFQNWNLEGEGDDLWIGLNKMAYMSERRRYM